MVSAQRHILLSGFTQFLIGCLCTIIGIVEASTKNSVNGDHFTAIAGVGIWNGILFAIIGVLGMITGRPNKPLIKGWVKAYKRFSLNATFFSVVVVFCYAIQVTIFKGNPRILPSANHVKMAHGLIALGCLECIAGIWGLSCCPEMPESNDNSDQSQRAQNQQSIIGQVVFIQNSDGHKTAFVITEGYNGIPIAVPRGTRPVHNQSRPIHNQSRPIHNQWSPPPYPGSHTNSVSLAVRDESPVDVPSGTPIHNQWSPPPYPGRHTNSVSLAVPDESPVDEPSGTPIHNQWSPPPYPGRHTNSVSLAVTDESPVDESSGTPIHNQWSPPPYPGSHTNSVCLAVRDESPVDVPSGTPIHNQWSPPPYPGSHTNSVSLAVPDESPVDEPLQLNHIDCSTQEPAAQISSECEDTWL